MVQKVSDFSKIKTIIERQILNTLDFLFTDNQITETEVVKIARTVISGLDTASTTQDLFKHLRSFVNQYPLFKNNLQKTVTALNNSYGD